MANNVKGKPTVKITSVNRKDEECLPKSKYDLHLIEEEDELKEQREEQYRQNMNALSFVDIELFS